MAEWRATLCTLALLTREKIRFHTIIERYLETHPPWPHPEDLFLSNNGYGAARGCLGPAGVRVMLKRRCRSAGLLEMPI